jgi:hypothetical protein
VSGRAGAFSGAPQLSQNASPGIAAAPHCGHVTAPAVIGTAGAAACWGGAIGWGGIALVGVAEAAAGTGISAAPHWSQKRALDGLSTPHFGQKGISGFSSKMLNIFRAYAVAQITKLPLALLLIRRRVAGCCRFGNACWSIVAQLPGSPQPPRALIYTIQSSALAMQAGRRAYLEPIRITVGRAPFDMAFGRAPAGSRMQKNRMLSSAQRVSKRRFFG